MSETAGVELHGEDPGAGGCKGRGERPPSRPHVDDEVGGVHFGEVDEAFGPGVSELVEPPPGRTAGGHGAPSRRRP